MSLQIWLPLNGDLMNQGLSSAIISGTPVYATTGKIGGKSLNTGMLSITASDAEKILNNKTFSYACWIYVNADTGVTSGCSAFFGREPMSYGGNRQFTLFQYDNVNSLHWSWQNNTVTDSSTFTNGVLPNVFPSRQWTHLAVTYENPVIKFYINGKLKHTVSNAVSNSSSFNYTLPVAVGSASRYLNDVRIYDHCLSEKEVKDLAKGLVLHYRLAGPGQENLVTSLSAGGRTSIDGTYSVHTSKTNADTYFYANLSSSLNPGDKVTVSCDVSGFSSNNYQWNFPFWSQGSGLEFWLKNGHCSQTFTVPSGATASNRIIFDDNGAINGFTRGDSIIYIKNFKIERGSVQTPWCPNPADALYTALGYNNNIEYDCSGYRRNGTKSGTITWDIDSPRYTTSYKFGSNTSKIKLPAFNMSGFANSYTFSWWQYNIGSNNMPWGFSDGNRLNPYHTGNLCWNTGDGGSNPFVPNIISSTLYNSWHHIVITGNGTDTKLYIDGEYKGKATTYKGLTGTQIYLSGWDTGTGYTMTGSREADFRIYATALSAEDIAELYHSAVIVDNTGKNYAYEYFEA